MPNGGVCWALAHCAGHLKTFRVEVFRRGMVEARCTYDVMDVCDELATS